MATRDLVSLLFTADDRQVQQALTRTDKGLDGLGGQAEKSGGRVQKSFSGAGDSVKGLAGRIPGVGGALGALASPAGIATAAIGLVVGGIGAAVGKVSSLEKELRPMIQRSNLSAESLQVLSKAANRLGSEDGLDGVTDSAQELQLRLAEASQDASGPAVAAFEKLGLSSADLIAASPEESFLAVITALQGVSNESDRKFLADELLGGSSEKLSGIINTSSEEFQGLTDSIRENGDIISNEGISNANQFNIALGKLSGAFGGIASTVGTEFIPILTEIIEGVTEIWQEIDGPVLTVLRIFTGLLTGTLRAAFEIIKGAIDVVAGVLTGDFSRAWQGVQQIAQGVMNHIINAYNNTIGLIPGVSKIDMVAFADNVETSATDAEESLSTSMDNSVAAVRTAGGDLIKSEEDTSKAIADEHEKRLEETKTFWADMAKASAAYREKELAADLTQYDATNTEYRLALASLSTMSAEHLAALQAGNDDASDHELAMQIIANKRYADEQKVADDAAVIAAKTVADDALAAEIQHRADLVDALDAHIDIIAANVKTASGDEKRALETQIADLKEKRDAAYVASSSDRLEAAQSEIDAVSAKIETAQGAELAALKSHQALLLAQYGVLTAGINAELDNIKTPKFVDIVTRRFEEGDSPEGRFAGQGGDPNDPNSSGFGNSTTQWDSPLDLLRYNGRGGWWASTTKNNRGANVSAIPSRYAALHAQIEGIIAGISDPQKGFYSTSGQFLGELDPSTEGGAAGNAKAERERQRRLAEEAAEMTRIFEESQAKDSAAQKGGPTSLVDTEQPTDAQHGAIVLPRTGGTRVNVGEAGQAEAVIPLPDLAALAGNLMAGIGGGSRLGGGMSGAGGGNREVVLALDGERLGSVFLDQFNILQSENRLLVDLV